MKLDQYLDILHNFTLDLIGLQSREELYWYVAKEVVGKLGYRDCVIYILDKPRNILRQIAAIGPKNPHGKDILNTMEIPVGEGITGLVAQTKEACLINDLSKDEQYIKDIELANSELCVPICYNGNFYGVIDSEHESNNFFDQRDLEVFTEISNLMGAKIAQLDLVERDKEHTTIIESIQDIVILLDQEGFIKSINRSGLEAIGYTDIELQAMKLDDLICNENHSKQNEQNIVDLVACDGHWNGRIKIIGKDEETHQYDLLATAQKGANGELLGAAAVLRNVDDLVKTEIQQKRHATVFENVNDAILMFDTYGKIIDCNKHAQIMMGLDRKSMIGLTSAEFAADQDEWKQGLKETLEALISTGKFVGVGKGKHSSGKVFPFEVSMTLYHNEANLPLGTVAIMRDLSERENQLKKLKASEERFSLAVSGTNDGVWDWDIAGRKAYISPRYKEILGIDKESTQSAYEIFEECIHPDDYETVKESILDHLKYKKPYDQEFRFRHKKGHYVWVRSKGRSVWDKEGRAIRAAGSLSDVSDMKMALEELKRAKEEAEAANLSKSNFLANMSHEIRTPLNAVIGFAEALEMGVGADDPEKRNENLRIIADAGRTLNNVISDILDFSKIEAGKVEIHPESVLPSDVFRKNLPIIKHLTETNNISFKGIKKSDKKILVDRSRLDQILLNLISNSVKYNKPGGSLEFGCYEVPDNLLRIYVKDTGLGIDDEMKDLLFSPFDRIKQVNSCISGIGLGLAICKKLTEEMGGTIGYESTLGEGSTFWVEFPTLDSQNE